MSKTTKPRRPAGMGPAGGKFWAEVMAGYELNVDEMQLLTHACKTLDLLDRLQASIDELGITVCGAEGQPRIHPAVAQIMTGRALLGRLLSQLGLPDAAGETLPSPQSVRGTKAANARWAAHNAHKAQVAEWRRGKSS